MNYKNCSISFSPTGQITNVESFSIRNLIPDLEHFMTYEGSLTVPGCYETTTWIIINKSLTITRHDVRTFTIATINYWLSYPQLYGLRKIMQGDVDSPKAPLGNNIRPVQPINQRLIRTNIDFKQKQVNVKFHYISNNFKLFRANNSHYILRTFCTQRDLKLAF